MHSSQGEQDTRFYADFAMVPLLEPVNQQEAYEMAIEAFELSEQFRVPVILRMVTRLAHSRAVVRANAEPRGENELGKADRWTGCSFPPRAQELRQDDR
jgi:indolepyruvate ferredoxin oxidoreductase alpha subunit